MQEAEQTVKRLYYLDKYNPNQLSNLDLQEYEINATTVSFRDSNGNFLGIPKMRILFLTGLQFLKDCG